MLEFFLTVLRLKKCVNMVLKKLPVLTKHVSDRYKTQQKCYKATLKSGGISMFIPDRFRDQNM